MRVTVTNRETLVPTGLPYHKTSISQNNSIHKEISKKNTHRISQQNSQGDPTKELAIRFQKQIHTEISQEISQENSQRNRQQGLGVAGAAKHLQVLDVKTWRKRLFQLVGLLGVNDDKSVKVSGASDLELDVRLGLHDLDRPGILSARREEEVLDFVDLLWL